MCPGVITTGLSSFLPAYNDFAVTAVVSTTAPLVILVLFFQRQIVSGLTTGAVKG